MADLTPEDDAVIAAAAAALAKHRRVRAVLDQATADMASYLLVEYLDEGDDAAQNFVQAMWSGLDTLDNEDRLDAIAILLEPVAEKKARQLHDEMLSRLASVPEVPDVH